MKILGKKLSLKEFEKYVEEKNFGSLPPTFIVLHHTYNPTEDDGDGIPEKGEWNVQDPMKTLNGIKNYYEGKGWSAGPHIFIYDEEVFLFTDMYDVGIHAGAGNGSLKTGYSIGIEVVGNYDIQEWDKATKKGVVGVLKPLMEKLKIKESDIKFHRDYSSKSCPGKMITKEWVIKLLNEEPMNKNQKKLNSYVEDLIGEDLGEKINDKELKSAKKKLGKIKTALKTIDDIAKTSETTMIENVQLKEKVKNQTDQINFLSTKMSSKDKELADQKALAAKSLEAVSIVRLFQEAFKKLLNF